MDNKQRMLLLALASCFLLKLSAADPRIDDQQSRTTNDLQGSALRPKCPPFRTQYDFSSNHLNLRPIIGILATEESMKNWMTRKGWENVTSYVRDTFVKSFESAGARVVPIMINKSPQYYEMMAKNLNGIVFPSGNNPSLASEKLYEHVMNANANGTVLPLWSVNNGFLLLMQLESGINGFNRGLISRRIADKCNLEHVKNALIFVQGTGKSQMFGQMPDRLMAALQSERITFTHNGRCFYQETFNSLRLNDSFNILSTSFDKDGLEYISTLEHKNYPVFGTQWNPEKPTYHWRTTSDIPKTKEAMQVNTKLMEMFIDHARQNKNSFPDGTEEDHLIYKFKSYRTVYYFNERN